MSIHVRDPAEHDPQWCGRNKKDLPPEVIKVAEVLHLELRDHLKKGAPPAIIFQAAIAVVREMQVIASKKGEVHGKKGKDKPRANRSESKRVAIIREASNYKGALTSKVANIAKKTNASAYYVRKVLKEKGN